jgi:hypothetical protein
MENRKFQCLVPDSIPIYLYPVSVTLTYHIHSYQKGSGVISNSSLYNPSRTFDTYHNYDIYALSHDIVCDILRRFVY